jgi:hypothetical protein
MLGAIVRCFLVAVTVSEYASAAVDYLSLLQTRSASARSDNDDFDDDNIKDEKGISEAASGVHQHYGSARPKRGHQQLQVTPDTLVIIIGSLRGGELAWHSLLKHVVHRWNADMAVMTDLTQYNNKTHSLLREATYLWHEPEHTDWGEVLDTIPGADKAWRNKLCTMPAQFLGGVEGCHPGSAGILLAYRWRIQQSLLGLNAEGKRYKRYVLTRSDFLYGCDVPAIDTLATGGINVPLGEEYGGYTDRFAIMDSSIVQTALNVTRYLVTHPHLAVEAEVYNLETLLKWYWQSAGVEVKQFEHPAFTVQADKDNTRWESGYIETLMEPHHLLVKYDGEFEQTQYSCGGERFLKQELSLMDTEMQLHSGGVH